MHEIEQVEGSIFFTCTACMSVWADALSWANANTYRVVVDPAKADNIVIMSCQVTDLAILHDIRTTERYHSEYPNARIFVSGCLAARKDIELPEFVSRLETPRHYYQSINDRSLVRFEPPFWVPQFQEQDNETVDGHLFRNMYPLRIGKGCTGSCAYCTIRITRGPFEAYDIEQLEAEFICYPDVLLIADSPTPLQIKQWCALAAKHDKPISIRNVEPAVANKCHDELVGLAGLGLLRIFHSPVQSTDEVVLRDMGRSVAMTKQAMVLAGLLKSLGTYISTNIIVDYKDFEQDFTEIYELYDYVSWNPLWDGIWNREVAEERFDRYISRTGCPTRA